MAVILSSPVAILYDADGRPWSVKDGVAIPADTTGPLVHGSDGTLAQTIRTDTSGAVRVDPTGTTTQPISASTLPLPVGAATESTLATKLTDSTFTGRINTQGQKVMSASTPVVLASDHSLISTIINSDKNLDAFGRIHVSVPEALFESKLVNDTQPLFWDDQQLSGSGTTSVYNNNQASVSLSVSNLTAGTRVRQTFQRFNYQAGKSHGVLMTGILENVSAGITRRIGAFDAKNGVFFESSATAIRAVKRSFVTGSAVDMIINQSDWNLDKMNGTGISGINLDFSKVQIFAFQYQWLGSGSIWFGFGVNGVNHWAHRIDSSNTLSTVSLSTPNLPLRYEINNDGTGPSASMSCICCNIFSSGGSPDVGVNRAIYRNTPLTTLNNSNWFPLISIRLRSGYEGLNVFIQKFSINCQSSADYTWRLTLNPTVVGTPLSFVALSNSGIEYDATSTNATTITGGTDLDAETTQQFNSGSFAARQLGRLRLGQNLAGVSDTIVVAVRRDTGTAETFLASMLTEEHS